MISNVGKFIPFIFLITCIFVLLDSLISLEELRNVQNDQQRISDTYAVIHQVNVTSRDIIKSEADQRNYILSENEFYFSSYTNGWKQVEKDFTTLRTSLKNSPQQQLVTQFHALSNQKKQLLDEGIIAYQNGGILSAQQYIVTHNGKKLLDAIEAKGADIIHAENILLAQRRNNFITSSFYMYATIIVSTILNISLVLLAYFAIMRELRQRTLIEQKKNDFINLASHELKTPITTISIFAEILHKRLLKIHDTQTMHILFRMKNQVDEMKKLINDLLDITRIQLGKLQLQKEIFLLNTLINATVEDLQATTTKHKIRTKPFPKIYAYADKQRIWQVLANLLNNAIKYSPKGGIIEVAVKKTALQCVVSIQDEGIGISSKNQLHIFNRYFREEGDDQNKYTGLGLGLYLAQQILRVHGCRIWVKSAPGKGSIFFFTIPRTKRKRR